jgi:hypothetical protein
MSELENVIINEEEAVVETADKHENFKAQSAHLVRKAIVAIENVGKTANQKKYEYSEEEVERMFAALEEALSDTKHLYKKKKEFNW